MKQELRNLKGEIVQSAGQDEAWWRFSPSTWFLLAGLLLFNVGCFAKPEIMDFLIRSFDVRLWPWWYFIILTIMVLFSIRWFIIWFRRDEYDEIDDEANKRFVRFSIAVTIALFIGMIINAVNLAWYFTEPLKNWLGYGTFSLRALLVFIGLLGISLPLAYFFKEWIVTFKRPE